MLAQRDGRVDSRCARMHNTPLSAMSTDTKTGGTQDFAFADVKKKTSETAAVAT